MNTKKEKLSTFNCYYTFILGQLSHCYYDLLKMTETKYKTPFDDNGFDYQ